MKHRCICAALVISSALAIPRTLAADNRYVQHNLVSDLPGVADRVDADLVNPWGIATSSTSPFWIANNGKGLATVYNSSGARLPIVATVSSASGGSPSAPTGQVFNGTDSFVLAGAKPAVFLFCTEDGTISGWYNGIDKNNAVVAVNNSGSGAVYKGLALGTAQAGPVLYAANFHSGAIDVFAGDFSPKTSSGAFTDPSLPAGFAPFNVYVARAKVYVAYAKQDDDKTDDIPGDGNGFVNVFDTDGRLLQRLISGGRLNSPWGMAIAPAGFGDFSNALLVGNFGDGRINAYSPTTGQLLGTISDAAGKPIVIAGLWGLQFGNGGQGGDAAALYFTAGIPGPNGEPIEAHGLFGSIQAAPDVTADGIVSAAGFQKGIAPNSWISIFGKNLAPITRTWQQSDIVDGRLPTALDGVSVQIDGKPAYVAYISPTQLNVLTPATLLSSPITVQTKNGDAVSSLIGVESRDVSPAFFQIGKYAVATNGDGTSIIGPETLIPGISRPARAGDVIVLYGTGFGATNPPVQEGTVVATPLPVVVAPTISIGGAPAEVEFGGLTAPGLYQFNVKVPGGLADGDAPIIAQSQAVPSPAGVLTAIDAPAAPPSDSAAQIDNFQFTPNPADVSTGAKLTWTNKQDVVHTVVSDSGAFSSKILGQNETFSVTFDTPGTYSYHCSIHPFMKGQVVVK